MVGKLFISLGFGDKMGDNLVTYRMRGLNYSGSFGEDGKRCPYCGQTHLRSGYCQALDSLNARRYPWIWDGSIKVDLGHILAGSDYAEWREVRFADREGALGVSVSSELKKFDSASQGTDGADAVGEGESQKGRSSGKGATLCEPRELQCAECGKAFTSNKVSAKYCSRDCFFAASKRRFEKVRVHGRKKK